MLTGIVLEPPAAPPDLTVLALSIARARKDFQACRYAELLSRLPRLLSQLDTACHRLTGDDRLRACALSADADPAACQDWARKAASIAAYREMYGYDHPSDPIGPEPGHQTPDQRAAWHQAYLALCPSAGPDVRAMPNGRLWLLRDTYVTQTAWAPRHVGKELRLSRLGAFDATLGAARADAEAPGGPQDRQSRPRRTSRAPSRQLPRHARPLPAARTNPRPDHGQPPGMGARDSRSPQPGHRSRRRTTPSTPTPEDRAPALRRTSRCQRHWARASVSRPGRETHRKGHPDPRPGRAAPSMPRRDARASRTDGAWRRSSLGRARRCRS